MKKFLLASALVILATGVARVGTISAESGGAPAPYLSHDERYPPSGLRSIFRDDFLFADNGADVNPISVAPTRPHCKVKLLSRGRERLNWRLNLTDKSRDNIRAQTYIFSADEAGLLLAERLKAKRADGIDVRLTIDTYTKFKPADRRLFNSLELAGITIMGFEPWYLLGTSEKSILDIKDVNMRFHEKYWVFDTGAAIIGGANVANEYFEYGGDPDDAWRDQDVLLTGTVVHDIAYAFEDNYTYFRDRRKSRLYVNRAVFFKKPWWKIRDTEPPQLRKDRKPAQLGIPDAELDDVDAPVRFIRHRPRYGENYIHRAYSHLFSNARESIIIENAYFVPDKAITNPIAKAAKRGVKVIIITNSARTNDVKGMQPLSRYSYLPLIESGARVYEWQGLQPGHGCLHSKFAVIDGAVSIVGSCNLDPRSLNINSESVVLIDSREVAAKLANYVETVDIKNSREITVEEARKWRKPKKINEKFRLRFGMVMEDWY